MRPTRDEIPDAVILFFDDPFETVEPFFGYADTLSQIALKWCHDPNFRCSVNPEHRFHLSADYANPIE
jgi:hypothetical protein